MELISAGGWVSWVSSVTLHGPVLWLFGVYLAVRQGAGVMMSETPRGLLSIWGSDSSVRAQDLLPPSSSTLSGHCISRRVHLPCGEGGGTDRLLARVDAWQGIWDAFSPRCL